MRTPLFIVLISLGISCASSQQVRDNSIRRAAAVSIGCPAEQIKISKENNNLYKVVGCNQLTFLECNGDQVHTSCYLSPVYSLKGPKNNKLSH